MRVITAVWLEITTGCNRYCPECASGIGRRPVVHHPWSYFEALAPFMGGIEHVNITGGEPLFHPEFDDFAPRWKRLFGPIRMTVWTNGYRAREHEAALMHFETIWASRYGDNDDEIDWLVKRFGAGAWCGDHVPLARRGSGAPCGRGTTDVMVAYSGGRIFPCCVGPGIPGAQSLQLCPDWRTAVLNVPLPCADCAFSEAA